MRRVDAARLTLANAIAARRFPAAAVDVGSSDGPIWQDALGTLTFEGGAPAAALDTLFDLASLTKVVATTTLVMDLWAKRRIRLEDPAGDFFAEWRGVDRERVTVRDLLEHASGLPARLLDAPPSGRREFEHEICRMPLECAPRTKSIYSDLDFILLGFLAADRGGAPLPDLFARLVGPGPLGFNLTEVDRRRAAPTVPLSDDSRRGRTLTGEVHDNYAAALGGAAGHAGLFATAPAVGAFARNMLRAAEGHGDAPPPFSPEAVALFTTKSSVPGSSRALGWDTMLPTSSCGTHMSQSAFGHVGFTGTSLWIDPARGRYFVLLTNRAFGQGSSDDMQRIRRAFHDALAEI